MRRLLLVLVVIFFGNIAVGATQELEARIEAPICIKSAGCTEDLLPTARTSADRNSVAIKKCASEMGVKCKARAGIEDDERCSSEGPSWGRVEDLSDGSQALEKLKTNLKTGKLLSPTKSDAKVLVRASESTRDQQYVALCNVRVVKGISGPPVDCEAVAIIAPAFVIMRKVSSSIFCNVIATYRETGAIDISYNVTTSVPIDRFVTPIVQMLEKDLGFATDVELDKDDKGGLLSASYRSAAAIRRSSILPGTWWESINFDLRISRKSDGFKVHASTLPMVNRLNLGNLTSYTVPDDAQRKTYGNAFDKQIGETLTRPCASFDRIDSKTLNCR